MKRILWVSLLCALIQSAEAQDSTTVGQPFVLGQIVEFASSILSEKRVLNVYLPPGYTAADTTRYPVIYLLDGSADEDFIHVAGIVQFLNFPWVNSVPNSIVIGIANVDRRRDFTFPTSVAQDKKDFPTTGGSPQFISFLEKELQPFVERNFRTTTSKTIIGQSLGGLLATEILFTKPSLFNKYLIVSPSLWWDNESLLNKETIMKQQRVKDSIAVYVAVGNEGKQMEADVQRLLVLLDAKKKTGVAVRSEHFTKENHATIMHQAVYNGLCILNAGAVTPPK